MKIRGLMIKTVAAACAGMFAMGSQAAIQTLNGTTMIYTYDDVVNADALTFYGAPFVVGDTVVFTPGTNFRASSLNGEGTVEVSSTFIFDSVTNKDGKALMALYISESGDYSIDGSGSDVSVDLYLQGVTNPGGGTLGSNSTIASFAESGDTGGAATAWGSLDGELDLTAFQSPPFLGGTDAGLQTDVKVTIQNTVTATTTGSDDAWIQKKLTFVAVSEVPLPAAAWLFGSALLGLVAVGRRRRAA